MSSLNNNELSQRYGGISISGTLITAFTKMFNIFFEIGSSLGTSINMIYRKKSCKG